MERYRVYSTYLMERYGERVYKIPVNLPGSCPNRDGKVGLGGCTFCDEEGAGFECLENTMNIEAQIAENQAFFRRRFNAEKFIVYFQAFSNTYKPYEQFVSEVDAAVKAKDIVGLSISTRPDCVPDAYLDYLQKVGLEKGLDVDLELGLQTVNYHTLKKINRGHSLAEFLDTVWRCKERGIKVCAHVILNLPWDNEDDVVENAKILSAMRVDYVKLHSLYIVENTVMGQQYSNREFQVKTLAEYVDAVVNFLDYLSPSIVIQRLVGKGPKGKLLFSNWDTSWWKIKEMIEGAMEDKDTWQGKKGKNYPQD